MIRVILTGPTRGTYGEGAVPRLRVVTPGPSSAGVVFLAQDNRRARSSSASLPDAEPVPTRRQPPRKPRRSWSLAAWFRARPVRFGGSAID